MSPNSPSATEHVIPASPLVRRRRRPPSTQEDISPTRTRRSGNAVASLLYNNPLQLYLFSPFGAFCQKCKMPVSSDKACLRSHFLKHKELQFGERRLQECISFAYSQAQELKGTDPTRYITSETFAGFSCRGCGACFRRRSCVNRHARGKSQICITSEIVSEDICVTVCGRLVPLSRLSSTVPTGASVPFSSTAEWLERYVPGDEQVNRYLGIFHPLTRYGDPELTMSTYVNWCVDEPAETDEPQLCDLLRLAKTWLFERARGETSLVPANFRAAIMVFDGQSVGDVAVNITYNFRHFESNLQNELYSLLRFAWRRTSHPPRRNVLAPMKEAYHLRRLVPSLIPSILHALFVERVSDFYTHPVLVEYCLARCFRKRGDVLSMIKCDLTCSQVAATISILRAGICGYLCSSVDGGDRFAFQVVSDVRTSRLANVLCPFIRHLKEMHLQKGVKRMKTVSPEGDIAVQGFEFPKSVWSLLIPNVVKLCHELFSQCLDGNNWEPILDPTLTVSVVILEYERVVFQVNKSVGQVIHSNDVHVNVRAESLHFDRLVSYLRLAFFGFGGGSMRGTEVDKVFLSQATWHRNTFYYTTHSDKQFSFKSQTRHKTVEHKLPSLVARCFLLFRLITNGSDDLDLKLLIPGREGSQHSMNDAVTELFSLPSVPSTTQIRQCFTSISDYLFPDSTWDGVLSATPEVAEMSAHSAGTHRTSYGSTLLDGRELVYRKFHLELGGEQLQSKSSSTLSLTPQELLRGLCSLVGPAAAYKSPEQERLVAIVANSNPRHAHVGMPCGSGKSMAWLVPAVARVLAGKRRMAIFVVLPYKFLLDFHKEAAVEIIKPSKLDINVEGFMGTDIGQTTLPLCLQEPVLLPDIVFLSLEALVNLLKFHIPAMKRWVSAELIGHFIIDEIHTIYGESFRNSYETLPSLVQFEVPVMTMSGTVPKLWVPYLVRHLGMSSDDQLADVDIIEVDDCLGSFPPDFRFTAGIHTKPLEAAVADTTQILGQSPNKGVHILVSSKRIGAALFTRLSETFVCRLVTSDTSAYDQASIAGEWGDGGFQVLLSTTIGLVGNENRNCQHILIVGFLFSLMNVIQAVGRLRQSQRVGGSSVRLYYHILGQAQLDAFEIREHSAFESLRARKLVGENENYFVKVATISGLYDWLSHDNGCLVKNLSERYGINRVECRVCDGCRGQPTRRLARTARTEAVRDNVTANRAMLVLKKMMERCLHCGMGSCNGESCMERRCFRCGKGHPRGTCKESNTASLVLKGKACYQCFDLYQRRDYQNHDATTCPLKRRLRRMIFARTENLTSSFVKSLSGIYSDENAFYTFVASLEDRSNRTSKPQVTTLQAVQIADSDDIPNLLPPDVLPGVTYDMPLDEAKSLSSFQKKEPPSNKRKRGFVFGALYRNLFPGYYEVDHLLMGDVDLVVKLLDTGHTTVIKVRSALDESSLLRWIVELGESMPKTGSCRKGVGDVGTMYALGYRSKTDHVYYKQTKDSRTAKAMTEVCNRVTPFMRKHYPDILDGIQKEDKKRAGHVTPLTEMGGKDGPGGTISLSRNLGNSSHFDYADKSMSFAIWAELKKGLADNWYMIYPNMSINGSAGVVVKLRHGVAISWDGTLIRHCTSVTEVGADNNVYGCMFGGLNNL